MKRLAVALLSLALLSELGTGQNRVVSGPYDEAVFTGRMTDLAAMRWSTAAEGQVLTGWDMILTGSGARVEIEILNDGVQPVIDRAIAVIGRDGDITRRRRLPGDTYLILHPGLYRLARITKIIGDVFVASDKADVKNFFMKHQTGTESFVPQSGEDAWQWQESLKEPELR